MNGETRRARRVPMAPKILGAAGLLPPFLAIVARLAAGADDPTAAGLLRLGVLYAMLILSFVGGIWWGIAAARADEEKQPAILILSVVPTIVALALFALSSVLPLLAVILLALALMASPLGDAWLAAQGLVPAWWMRLRVPLSALLGVLTLGMALLLAL